MADIFCYAASGFWYWVLKFSFLSCRLTGLFRQQLLMPPLSDFWLWEPYTVWLILCANFSTSTRHLDGYFLPIKDDCNFLFTFFRVLPWLTYHTTASTAIFYCSPYATFTVGNPGLDAATVILLLFRCSEPFTRQGPITRQANPSNDITKEQSWLHLFRVS